jgi:multiple RNA-binding domain-containing protein 1
MQMTCWLCKWLHSTVCYREALAKEGVNLACLNNRSKASSSDPEALQRSNNVILVKNLPATTEERDLVQLFSKHGALARVVLPPSRTIALVEFIEAREARSAFRGLAYRRFQHVPLYLEWVSIDNSFIVQCNIR